MKSTDAPPGVVAQKSLRFFAYNYSAIMVASTQSSADVIAFGEALSKLASYHFVFRMMLDTASGPSDGSNMLSAYSTIPHIQETRGISGLRNLVMTSYTNGRFVP
jgi:hypothetical protein